MPVKFRCQHCKQLLGISHKKIGQVVDCPKCGRSVRVPEEDGVAHAPPKPEFNLEDSALVRALDELAAIGQPQNSALSTPDKKGAKNFDDEEFGGPDFDDADDRPLDSANRSSLKGAFLAPPSVVHADPPLPAVKVDAPTSPVTPVPAAAPQQAAPKPQTPSPAAQPGSSPAAIQPSVAAQPAAATTPDSAANWQAVASIAPAGSRSPILLGPAPSQASQQRLVIAIAAVAGLLGGLLIGFAGGYLLRPTSKRADTADLNAAANAAKPAAQALGLSGKISHKTAMGEGRPDEGARVLVLPENRNGTLKLSAVGLRQGDNAVDEQVATAAVRALGGDLGVTDAEGRFTTQLPGAGKYHVIVVSGRQGSDAESPADLRDVNNVLSAYLDKPADFIGQRAVHHELVRYQGEGTAPWDFSFTAAP